MQHGTDHLVIGDPHVGPNECNSRFDLLARLILDRQPPVIVCMGDFADMDSLSSYDKGKKSFEGRRFNADCDAVIDAQRILLGPIAAYNQRRKEFKERQYRPRLVMLGGNHDEGRIERIIQTSPELDGLISLTALKYVDFGWEYVPYRVPIKIDGVLYCHHFPSGPLGRPIGGIHIANSLLAKNFVSSTVGHDHRLDVSTQVSGDGSRILGLNAGRFFERIPAYAIDTARMWWSGVVYKHGVLNGEYDPEFISIGRLRRDYGGNSG